MTIDGYVLREVLNENLIILSSNYGNQVWTKIVLRKDTICRETGFKLNKGDKAFRPITNRNNRMHRISLTGMKRLVEEKEQDLN